jgi:hypothetical protein
LKTPVWIGSFSDRRSVEFLGAAEVEKPSAYYLQAQKLHGKGHFAGNLESYLLDLSTLTLTPPGDWSGQGEKEQKITPGSSLFTSRREDEPPGGAGPWGWSARFHPRNRSKVCIYSANLTPVGTSG